MKYVKKLLIGYILVMGCKIFELIGKLLLNCWNVVFILDISFNVEGVDVIYFIEDIY